MAKDPESKAHEGKESKAMEKKEDARVKRPRRRRSGRR